VPLRFIALCSIVVFVLLSGCSSPSYVYRYVPGKTATLSDGRAVAPAAAPPAVQAAIAAANRIAGLPYCYGAGHGRGIDTAYDCSGATSFVLHEAGLLDEATTSDAFRHYGERGGGDWITLYARHGHVFLSVAGVRFDTGWGNGPRGPQWTIQGRPASGAVLRHPVGL
jgi:hypothetical protein